MDRNSNHRKIKSNLSKEEMSNVFSIAKSKDSLIDSEDTSAIFYDLSFLVQRVDNLRKVFPSDTLHAVAVKANPLTKILKLLQQQNVGLEVASSPELYLAENSGLSYDRIVFDSPSKTRNEIEYALEKGIHINADSFDELERIDFIMKKIQSQSNIGVRINPQVGSGSIKATSVADFVSKFGIPMNNNRNKLKECFLKYHWLKGIHVHIGSQGCPVSLMIDGIRKVLNFANEVNISLEKMNRRIEIFDIGGGLAVSYFEEKKPVSIAEYQEMLAENFPELFQGKFKLITEFGRYIHANTGWAAARVEYVKRENDYNIIMTHLGADFLLRKCYNPFDWHHQISVVDETGQLKTGTDINKYIVAGPLCFAGDVIARDIELPFVKEGDFILIHDVGAYTLSMWSRYNSRQIPKVIGYWGKNYNFEILKQRESKRNLFEFWS
jgi:diaminopimelate decarboxylase